jgi:flagellar motor protein MotB
MVRTAAVGDNRPIYLEVMPSGEAGNRRTEIYLTN